MPRAVIADSRPDWAKPDTASVTDSAATRALRWAAWATGMDKPDSQITALMAPLETGPVGGLLGQVRKFIRAYHGSPHDFDRFDLSKIGTGEGAQTYGHGLYFSEAEPVAQSYRDKLAGKPPVIVGGQEIPTNVPGRFSAGKPWDVSDDPQQMVATRIATKVGQQRAIGRPLPVKTALDHIEAELEQGMYRAVEQRDERLYNVLSDQRLALQRMREAGIDVPTTGHMYEVNLHTDPARLLDWDRPAVEQPHVLDVLREHGYSGEGLSGRDAYRLLQEQFNPLRPTAGLPYWETEGEAAARASQHLNEAGVPGIKYLDQLSRGRPDPALLQKQLDDAQAHLRFLRSRGITDPALVGSWERHEQQAADRLKELQTTPDTRNIVLFRDSPIEILRKYGLVPAVPAAAQLATTPQSRAASDLPPLPASPPRSLPAPAPVTAGPHAGDPEWTRDDGTPKGNGFLGVLPRPDGTVSSEISIGVTIDGKEVEIPTMVPTLSKAETQWLLTHDVSDPSKFPRAIIQKAVDFAKPRLAAGQSPFAGPEESPMPQAQPDETMRAQLPPAGSIRRPITRVIDGVPHLFDPAQIDGPTGGWIPQTGEMPTSATVTPPSPQQPAFPTFSGPPRTVISRTPQSNAEDLATLKNFLTLTGATAGSMALGPGAAAPWLLRAGMGLTGAAAGGGTFRAAADVPVNLFDYAAGRPSSPENDVGRDFAAGAEGGAGMEATSLAAGPLLKLGGGAARLLSKLALDTPGLGNELDKVIPGLGTQLGRAIRIGTGLGRAYGASKAGLPAWADIAAGTVPPIATWAAPRLAEAGEVVGSRTLGERASSALQWLESRLPGILKGDAPGAAAATAAEAAESPAVAASRARFQARQAAPARQAAEAAAGRTRVIEPRPMEPWEVGQEWVEGPPTPTTPPAAAAPPPAPAAPAAPRPVGRSQTQWQQFQQPPRVTPAGNVPIGAPAAEPGIELNLSGPNVLPPTAADLAAESPTYGTGSYFTENPATAESYATPATATERLQQQAGGLKREPMTAQQLEAAHAQMTRANAAAREAEASAAGPLEGEPATRTLPDGSVVPWDDAAAQADADTYDPVAEFLRAHPEAGGDPYQQQALDKATAQERRMSALTNKAIRPDLLPASSGLRDAGDLSFDPATGEIGKWADVPDTATDRLVRAMQRPKKP